MEWAALFTALTQWGLPAVTAGGLVAYLVLEIRALRRENRDKERLIAELHDKRVQDIKEVAVPAQSTLKETIETMTAIAAVMESIKEVIPKPEAALDPQHDKLDDT